MLELTNFWHRNNFFHEKNKQKVSEKPAGHVYIYFSSPSHNGANNTNHSCEKYLLIFNAINAQLSADKKFVLLTVKLHKNYFNKKNINKIIPVLKQNSSHMNMFIDSYKAHRPKPPSFYSSTNDKKVHSKKTKNPDHKQSK